MVRKANLDNGRYDYLKEKKEILHQEKAEARERVVSRKTKEELESAMDGWDMIRSAASSVEKELSESFS